jgi:hypothetical protein
MENRLSLAEHKLGGSTGLVEREAEAPTSRRFRFASTPATPFRGECSRRDNGKVISCGCCSWDISLMTAKSILSVWPQNLDSVKLGLLMFLFPQNQKYVGCEAFRVNWAKREEIKVKVHA